MALAYCAALTVLMLAVIGLINLVVGRRRLGRRLAPTAMAMAGGCT